MPTDWSFQVTLSKIGEAARPAGSVQPGGVVLLERSSRRHGDERVSPGRGASAMVEHLLPATVIGSWSFPGWFEKFAVDVKSDPEQFGPADRDEAVRDAVRLAIDDQLRAGFDRITDGEMQRVDFNLGFYEFIRGIEPI